MVPIFNYFRAIEEFKFSINYLYNIQIIDTIFKNILMKDDS